MHISEGRQKKEDGEDEEAIGERGPQATASGGVRRPGAGRRGDPAVDWHGDGDERIAQHFAAGLHRAGRRDHAGIGVCLLRHGASKSDNGRGRGIGKQIVGGVTRGTRIREREDCTLATGQ